MAPQELSKEDILKALNALSAELASRGTKGELCLFGGAVMVLAYSARLATKDVDAIFQPAQTVRDAAARVAEQNNLDPDWLNDAVKGYVSAKHETIRENLPQFPNLTLVMPTPQYLLAMKCMASRIELATRTGGDVRDIRFLIQFLDLKSPEQVLDIVASYYPISRIPVKAKYLVESLFEKGDS